jgi:hypothetical protein
MVFEQNRIARGRPTMGAKSEGDNLGSVPRARRYVPAPPESTSIGTIHLLEMYTLLFIRAAQLLQ